MSYIGNRVTSSTFVVDVFSGTGGQTVFTGLTFAPAGTAAIAVFVGGSYQSPTSYTVSGTTLTFNIAPSAGSNNIQVLHLGVGATSITVSDGSITEAKIAGLAVTGAKIAASTITGDKIAAATITGDKIAAATIGTSNLTTTGVSAGIYGGASNSALITVGVDGRITSVSNVTISGGGGGAITITNDTNTNSDTFYPLLSNNVVSGTLATANTSNTKLYYNANTGTLNATNFNSLSDEKYKKDIIVISNALNAVNQIQGVEFNWVDNGKKSAGFIAQEVEKILPHLVDTGENGKTINYQGIIAYLVETVKDLNARLEKIEKENGV